MWNIEPKFKVKVGGNYYVDCQDIILIKGEPLFRIKRREEDGLLAVDFDVYDVHGEKVATIRNAHVVGGNTEDYEFHKEKHRYWVVERKSGRTICDVRQVSKAGDDCEIDVSVDLFTKNGFRFIADPDKTNLPQVGITMLGCTLQGGRAGISVG